MKVVRELEAWSLPGQVLDEDYGKDLQQKVWDLGIPKDVFLGVSNIPCPLHCEILEQNIAADVLTKEAFQKYCEEQGLDSNDPSGKSAAEFLQYSLGTCVAWIYIPVKDMDELLHKIIRIVEDLGHIVIEPETLTRMTLMTSIK